jgi:hypothetical protein
MGGRGSYVREREREEKMRCKRWSDTEREKLKISSKTGSCEWIEERELHPVRNEFFGQRQKLLHKPFAVFC